MSLKIRFRYDGRCGSHPRYNPQTDGGPQDKRCAGCESLYVISLYVGIARKRALAAEGIIVSRPEQRQTPEQAPQQE